MALHLIKLSVGSESIRDHEEWVLARTAENRRAKRDYDYGHITRMVPKRVAELVEGGSLYWVIKGQMACRQKLLDIRPFTDAEGVGRCRLVLEPVVVAVEPRPYRPFQGWRYLDPKDAPHDLSRSGGDVLAMPETLRRELASLGLI